MKTLAIVPCKDFASGKTRLRGTLNLKQRSRLAADFLDLVLSAISRSDIFDSILVVGKGSTIQSAAAAHGAKFLREDESGLNKAVAQALRYSSKLEAGMIMIALADLPLLTRRAVERTVTHLRAGEAVLCPSFDGGTNLLAISSPDMILPQYGRLSFLRHLDQLLNSGRKCIVVWSRETAFDVDNIESLEWYRQMKRRENG